MFILIRTIQVDKNASGTPGRKVTRAYSCRPAGNCAGIEECVIASVAPDAAEVVRWGGLSYFHEGAGGIVSAGICQIGIHADHIRLAVVHGAFIKDPHQLFVGDQKYKRYVKIVTFDTAPWEDLKELITISAQFNPKSLEL